MIKYFSINIKEEGKGYHQEWNQLVKEILRPLFKMLKSELVRLKRNKKEYKRILKRRLDRMFQLKIDFEYLIFLSLL